MAQLGGGGSAAAQSKSYDDRDRVTLRSGKVVKGRVVSLYENSRVVLKQGGKRLRFPHNEIRGVHTVDDDLRQFFVHRKKVGDNAKRKWFLVEWAQSKGLTGLARLQALSIVLEDPSAEKAQAFLGHRMRKGEWLWPVQGRWVTYEAYEQSHGKWGTALKLTGEHFRVTTDAGVARALAMLFDLERLYLFWEKTFGPALGTQVPLEPIDVHAWAKAGDFPKISADERAYYSLRGEAAMTFFRGDAMRPEELFAVATQAMIYSGWVENGTPYYQETSHLCAWAEIGIGQWMERAFGGDPGWGEPLPKVRLDAGVATTVFRANPRLNLVIHLPYRLYYEFSPRVDIRWTSTQALVHYLMSEKPDPTLRQRFLAYLVRVFRRGLGDSSSAFDKTMGEKVESLQPKFARWLRRQS